MRRLLALPLRATAALVRTALSLPERERAVATLSLLAAVIGIAWGATTYVRRTTDVQPALGGTLTLGAVGQPRFILPILAQTSDTDMDLSRLVYSGLLTVTPDGQLTGDLAERVDLSDDGKAVTATLREGVRWHDGEPLTADDVLFTIQLLKDPAVKSPLAPAFQGVAVEKTDDRTVRLTLAEPYAPFLASLTVGILPSHVWAEVPHSSIALSEHVLRPIGTGPFRFEKLKKAEFSGEVREYRLTRNPSYHGTPPYLERIVFALFSTTDDLFRALRRHEIDGVSLLPPSLVADADRTRAVRLERLRLPQYFAVFFNQAKSAPLADVAVRRSLDAAVDRDRLIAEALHGEGIRVDRLLLPLPQSALPLSTPDVERARRDLEAAGWTDADSNGIREKDGTPLAFTVVASDWPEYVETAKLLAAQWQEIGADVTVQPAEAGTLQAEILRPRNYQALLYGEVLGLEPDPYPFWHSTQTRDPGVNLALFKDREADRLLEEARKSTDAGKRHELYGKFVERIAAEMPAIFLYSPTVAYALPHRLRGTFLTNAPLPADRFATVQTWYLKTKRVRAE